MKWTNAQQNAIDIPVSDIIISAAAGSGKTAVMAERIINRLTGDDYVDIDRILVVTYTNAAASEIKERVMKKIVDKLSETESEILQKQLVLIDKSHFCTIHSFCLELIKKYFYILGIDPMVKTGDPADLDVLLNQAVSSVTDEYLISDDREFKTLINAYGNSRESYLESIIVDIYKFSRTMPDSNKWLDTLSKSYDELSFKPKKFITETVQTALEFAKNELTKALYLIENTNCCAKWQGNIFAEKNAVEKACRSNTYEDLYANVLSIVFDRLPVERGVSDENVKAEIKACRDMAKKTVADIIEKFLPVSPEYMAEDNKNVKRLIIKLAEAVKKLGEAYSELKREKNLIDFSDYEHMVLELLKNPDGTPSEIAYAVSSDFEEIYIDEYQDCNNIQNEIFKLISGSIRNKPNVFCVGDMKQSIYKFRDANPLNFKQKCDDALIYDGKTVNMSNKILLNSNFRSRSTVLDFVNSVFSQIMSNDCGEITYDENEALNYGGGYIDINPDINMIDIDIINESNDFGDTFLADAHSETKKIDAEIIHIASKIKNYINSDYMLYDKKTGTEKKAEYSDIAVLFRSPSPYLSAVEQIFTKYKIPYYCDTNGDYINTEEIDFLVSFMKIIDNPDDDIALAAVMKNPLIGFDENKLLKIRLDGGKSSFYHCIKNYIENYDDKLKLKLRDFISLLEELYFNSRYMGTADFLSFLVDKIKYNVYLSAFPDSKLRKTNVLFLINKAREFEKNNFRGIYSFIKYIENIQNSDIAQSGASTMEGFNAVRIMSVHKSKGLEFPIVFLGGTGKRYNMIDANSKVVMHKDLGIGMDCVYLENQYRIPTINKLAIKQKIKLEAMSEELRVLYVALTRPTEKLIITGTVKGGAGFLNNIERMLKNEKYRINPYIISKSKCFLETILMAAMRSNGFEGGSDTVFEQKIEDNVLYNLTLKNISEIALPDEDFKSCDWKSFFKSTTPHYDKICADLSYKYPYSDSSSIPGNITVTEIKHLNLSDEGIDSYYSEISLSKPNNFANDDNLRGNALGTLIHLCMEKLDFTKISDEASVEEQLSSFVYEGIISDNEKSAIDASKITAFAGSSLCRHMISRHHTLKREFSFKHFIDASEIYDVKTSEKIIVQGTIDAFYEDEDGDFVIVDYKTDKVKNADYKPIIDRYRVQLDCYAKALESIYNKKVKKKIIYLFDIDEAVEI